MKNIDKEVVFVFLDNLRDSRVVNMFGATPYISKEFGTSDAESRKYLTEWMDPFSARHPNKQKEDK